MADVLKKFGRYFLLDHVAQGGMAEIYRARLASPDGAGRLLVIKRIQAGYGENSEFQQMFKSEIKVTMGFNHPNIVSLYDFGEEQGQPYIAMEFVDGRNLRQFLTRSSELKQSFPVEVAAYIMEQAASGLHYAHFYKDKISGQSLNIVHRDISPQNILISYDGNAKIIDFGIAKATTNSESTRAGVIKGKPSYLSPEQISGEPLDGRCDLFALGIVLWELLTGKKLFAGENDLAVLKLIESCNQHVKPPSTLNPKVPKELDYIVLKALAKQREKRYQTGEEMQRALHKFLYSFSPDFNPNDLSYYAKDLFKNEIVEDRKKLQRLSEKAEQLLGGDIPEVPASTDGVTAGVKREDTTTLVESRDRGARTFDAGPVKGAKVEMDMASVRSAGTRSRSVTSSPGVVPPNRTMGSMRVAVPPQRIEKKESSGGLLRGVLFGTIGLVAVAVLGPEFGIEIPGVSPLVKKYLGEKTAQVEPGNASKNESAGASTIKSPAVSTTPEVAPTGKTVLLRLNISPGGGGVTLLLNGKSIDPMNPVITVPLDAPLELSAERQGFRPFRREFVLESRQLNDLKEWLMDIQLEPVRFGYVTLRTTPSADATIMIDGKPWVKKTPLENEKIPVGTYSIKLSNDVLGMEKNVNVTIIEGKAISIDERLEIKN